MQMGTTGIATASFLFPLLAITAYDQSPVQHTLDDRLKNVIYG
jgi:hypothetical protein